MQGSLFQQALATQRAFAELCKRLRELWRLERLPVRHTPRSFFDTFDWRLYRKGWVLEFDESPPATARLRGTGAEAGFEEHPLPAVPRFAREFPPGMFRGQLDSVIGARALLPLGSVDLKITPFRALDDQGKVLFYLEKEQVLQPDPARRGRTVIANARVRTLRGYGKDGRSALALLNTPSARAARLADPFERCMRMHGRVPGEYSSRPDVDLAPDLNARSAIARILLALLAIMERNVPGLDADLDQEFLHDFRIAARRSRSLINRTQGVFTAAEIARIKREFSWLSQITSGQRDLDMFLEELPRHLDAMDAGRPHLLDPLRGLLQEERSAEHARLNAALVSDRFQGFVRDWRTVLAGASESRDGPALAVIANGSIRRQYRRLLKHAPAAGDGLYTEALHDLRKHGKQLRYLLEAFRSLYPEDEIEAVIAQLRRLQNVLGDIVDCHVLRTRLLGWRERLATGPEIPAEAIAVLDRLAGRFETLEQQAASRFVARYAKFSATENTARFDRLFADTA